MPTVAETTLRESPKAGSALTCSFEHVTNDHPQIGVKAELPGKESRLRPSSRPDTTPNFPFQTQPQPPHRMATMSKAVPVESKSSAPAPKSKVEVNVATHAREKN